MLSLVPGEPKAPQSSKQKLNFRSNRNVNTASTSGTSADNHVNPSAKDKSSRNNTTMEELDKMLEKDALMLVNMKKELEKTQKAEIDKTFIALSNLQKEHDMLKKDNDLKRKTLQKNIDNFQALLTYYHNNIFIIIR